MKTSEHSATAHCQIKEEHAVLTGGHYRFEEESVKYEALSGAIAVSEKAILIGICPRQISKRVGVTSSYAHVEANDNARYAFVHTMLRSHERNPLTGQAADVFIALEGAKGTGEELNIALTNERPVIFLKSWLVLRKHVDTRLVTVKPLQADSAPEAVEMARKAVGWRTESPRLTGSFPNKFPIILNFDELKADYEQRLLALGR